MTPRARAREAERVVGGLDDDGVADQRAHQRLVLGGEDEAIDERADDALAARRHRGARAGDERAAARRRCAARPPLVRRELGEERDAALDVAHDHALQLGADEARRRPR